MCVANLAIEWIAAHWDATEITARDLQQKMPRPRPKKVAQALSILRTLDEYGYLVELPPGDREKTTKFSIHPRIADFIPRGEELM